MAMHGSNGGVTTESVGGCGSRFASRAVLTAIALAFAVPGIARADEGGVSFWIPGFFGSLAAVPSQAPGWSVTSIYYHDSVSGGANVALAREFELGRVPGTLTASASFTGNVNASVNIDMMVPAYTF